MKLNTQSVLSALDASGVALADRSYLLSVALARAVAYRLPLPTSPIENPYLHFTTTHKANVEAVLGEVNERIVVDIDATCDLICRLWVFRYRLVFDTNNQAVRSFFDAMVKVGSRELPPKLSEWLIRYESTDAIDQLTRSLDDSIVEGV